MPFVFGGYTLGINNNTADNGQLTADKGQEISVITVPNLTEQNLTEHNKTKEKDSTPPPPSRRGEKRNAAIKEIWERYSFSTELEKAVRDWGKYKREKRQEYKPEGLKTLLSAIRNRADEYGEAAVIELIRDSMAANYTGITWDRLRQTGGVTNGRTDGNRRDFTKPGFDPKGMAGFHNALDEFDFDEDGNIVGERRK
jgi:hypothetical protein